MADLPAPPRIRTAGPDDAAALSALGWETFLETFVRGFGLPYAPDDLDAFFAEAHAPDRWAAALADPARRAWIAEAEGRPLGLALAGPCALPHPDARPQDGELKRLYLLPEAQGAGLAPRLMDAALAWLEARGNGPLWLGVWSGNVRAQRFYARYGFTKAGEYEYPVGAVRDHEFILRRG